MKRVLVVLVVLSCLATVPTASAATSISGTVTVENGTADGARVTVVPATQTLQRAGESARTTVRDSSFSVEVADAPRYVVRVEYDGTTHYEVLQNATRTRIDLGGTLEGRVVDDSGTPLSGVSVDVIDDGGFVVTTAETGADGTLAVGPVEPNETYQLRATVDGVPYRRTVTANESVTMTARPPTSNASALHVAPETRPAYVLQVVPPRNASGVPSVVQTVTLRNTADRPFAGSVTIPVPANATPYAGMVDNREAEYRRIDAGVRLDVTVPANGTVRVGAAYDLTGQTLTTTLRRDAPSLTVVVQGYDPNAVDHSSNLRVGDAPVSLLVSDGPVAAGESIRLDLEGARSQQATAASGDGSDDTGASTDADAASTGSAGSNTIPSFPGVEILGAVGGMVVVALVGYRLAPDDG
ncbi:carboxypeptidase regulatory-like domain-containing protein [Haloplanus rubicundus]|uniref:Carboxypeptidase regulatory-like domain-containing protein n=1 Tax=Haloplanus rubicundus TaxID=1547898 RepID=A0A345E6D0_9EURY|nr:carboxypeptidase-like regulatory domain-containing protein [Haloplanus rubicundus]AXG07752.1 carboxypeptidase regulatory-like domain-containing protein [Haloplanus rubicundus]